MLSYNTYDTSMTESTITTYNASPYDDSLLVSSLQNTSLQNNSLQNNSDLCVINRMKQQRTDSDEWQVWQPHLAHPQYDNFVSFINESLDAFGTMLRLNKTYPIKEYKVRDLFDMWDQVIRNTKLGFVPTPNVLLHPSFVKDLEENTIAMLLAKQKIKIPPYLKHKSEMRNMQDETVAMLYAENGIIPPKEWCHADSLQNSKGQTVLMLLIRYQFFSKHEYGQRLIQHEFDKWFKTIPKCWIHNPLIRNKAGNTVAMLLSRFGIIAPPELQHDPRKQNYSGVTVAEYLTHLQVNVPVEWRVKKPFEEGATWKKDRHRRSYTEEKPTQKKRQYK